jgi:hypothetical protein
VETICFLWESALRPSTWRRATSLNSDAAELGTSSAFAPVNEPEQFNDIPMTSI